MTDTNTEIKTPGAPSDSSQSNCSTLGDKLPEEIARVQEVLIEYDKCGAPGALAASFMRQDLRRASDAMIQGDVVEMIGAYHRLKEYSL